MNVHVLYFATLRERRGIQAESLDIADGTTVAQLLASLFPDDDLPAVAFTRNRAIVPAETVIEAGDEISFLPPLGGG